MKKCNYFQPALAREATGLHIECYVKGSIWDDQGLQV